MKLIDTQDRSKLCEGRNSGIGFAFCQRDRLPEDTLTTIMPISPCKDFLNDVVYSEQTGKPFSMYGLNTSKKGIFTDAAYMVMGIMPANRTTNKVSNHAELEAALMSPETRLEPFLSHFEHKLGFGATRFLKVAENRMSAALVHNWVKGTYLISLWSLLVRVGLKFNGGDPMAFLASVNDNDAYYVKAAIPKLERMMSGEIPVQDLNSLKDIHNCGIVGFQFPDKK